MADTDALLLRRFCDTADPEAFSEIVKLYAGVVYGACKRIIHDSDVAADVAQDTFFQLLRNAEDVSGSLAGWLHTVATRKAINVIRKDSARKARESEYISTKLQEAESWEEVSPYVDEALGKIDDHLRQVLVEHFLEGLTTRQLGEKIGISQATVSRRVNAGLDSLRSVLKKRGVIVASVSLAPNGPKRRPGSTGCIDRRTRKDVAGRRRYCRNWNSWDGCNC
jgi:RNA polymerase sigma factor (sigma-70 family)